MKVEDLVGDGGQREISADTVIYAAGQKALSDDAQALREAAPEFYQIGDCLEPANIMQATQLAYQIARDLGRV
jgi:NADH dehydrogenase FAD-containing subunit